MNFKETINNLVSLFDTNILDAQSFKNAVVNSIEKYHFIPVFFTHEILDFGFEVEKVVDHVVVSAYKNGRKIHTRVITDSDNDTRIYNYCNKFACNASYRNRKMRDLA